MAGKGLFIVVASIAPEKEEAFNRWYNEDHLPKALERLPGIISGRRYKIMEGAEGYKYMAVYEFESYEAMLEATKGEAIKPLIKDYNEKFGQGGRYHIRAVETKSLFNR
jgi:hypothetical protein